MILYDIYSLIVIIILIINSLYVTVILNESFIVGHLVTECTPTVICRE